jgi:hypothetical protein
MRLIRSSYIYSPWPKEPTGGKTDVVRYQRFC